MIKYEHFALNNIYLTNGYIERVTDHEIEHEYEQEQELEQFIRLLLLRKPDTLCGWDLRFLRKGLELSQADFGCMVDRDAQTVARWEKSATPIPKTVDLMIRSRFAERFDPSINASDLLKLIDGGAQPFSNPVHLSLTNKGWGLTYEVRRHTVSVKAQIKTDRGDIPSTHEDFSLVFQDEYHIVSGIDFGNQNKPGQKIPTLPTIPSGHFKSVYESSLASTTHQLSGLQIFDRLQDSYSSRTLQ